MRAIWTILLLANLAAAPAAAGAWLRAEGTGFLSVTSTLYPAAYGIGYETSVYADFGVTRRLTLGLDLHDVQGQTGHLLAFARLPLVSDHRRTRIALELALGGHYHPRGWDGMAKATLSLGRPFVSRWGPGWISLDLAQQRRSDGSQPVTKLDATAGLTPDWWLKPIIQLETYHVSGSPIGWTLTPGVRITGPKDTTWVLGVQKRSAGDQRFGVKLGLWRQF